MSPDPISPDPASPDPISAEIARRLTAIEQRLTQLEARLDNSENVSKQRLERPSEPEPITPQQIESDPIQAIEFDPFEQFKDAPVEPNPITPQLIESDLDKPVEPDAIAPVERIETSPQTNLEYSDSDPVPPESNEVELNSPIESVENPPQTRLQRAPEPSPIASSSTEATLPTELAQFPDKIPNNSTTSPITRILGWGGATALVLAAAYLIRLAIADGWFKGMFTPSRQIAMAIAAGLALIGAGIQLKKRDRDYASLLPAGGLVILFLATYGAHLYYGLINQAVAGLGVMAICLGALALCREFKSQLYAFFAVIGSYSAPFLLGNGTGRIVDLVIYYSCWSVVFCLFSLQLRSRGVYFVALYLGLIGFGVLWWSVDPDAWIAALTFQFLQLIIYAFAAAFYGVKYRQPLTAEAAIAYVPALAIFYGLQYAILAEHLPKFVPGFALLSVGILWAAYRFAYQTFPGALGNNQWLLKAYGALILLHAIYWETVPAGWRPWAAPGLLIAAMIYPRWRPTSGLLKGPINWTVGAIFIGNYLRLVLDLRLELVLGHNWLLILYAAQLYWLYALAHKQQDPDKPTSVTRLSTVVDLQWPCRNHGGTFLWL